MQKDMMFIFSIMTKLFLIKLQLFEAKNVKYELPLPLKPDAETEYRWYVIAYNDFQSMQGSKSSFYISDCVPPEINIIQPKEDSIYERSTLFDLTGVCSDDVGVTILKRKLQYWNEEEKKFVDVPSGYYNSEKTNTELSKFEKDNAHFSLVPGSGAILLTVVIISIYIVKP